MAIGANALTGAVNAADQTSYTTASISPTANALVVLAVVNTKLTTPDAPAVSGGGMTTWTLVDSTLFNTIAAPTRLLSVFRALQASPGSAAVTIDFAGVTQTGCIWSIVEFTGVDTGGSNGANAVAQFLSTRHNTGSGAPHGDTISLSAFASANHRPYGAWVAVSNSGTQWAVGSGFTQLHQNAIGAPATVLFTEWHSSSNDNTVDATHASDVAIGGIALEIAEPAAAATHLNRLALLGVGS